MSTTHYPDIFFSVIATPKRDEDGGCFTVDFTVKKIVSLHEDGTPASWECDTFGQAERIETASTYLHGFIRWDGCSNWHFDEQDRVMLHFCGRSMLADVGILLTRMYDLAREHMPELP